MSQNFPKYGIGDKISITILVFILDYLAENNNNNNNNKNSWEKCRTDRPTHRQHFGPSISSGCKTKCAG